MSNNIYVKNHLIPEQTSKISQWHYARNLIDGATDHTQTKKLLEEFTELVAANNPDMSSDYIFDEIVSMLDALHQEGRIKPVSKANALEAKEDAIGDMYVVLVNIAERNKFLMGNCIQRAWVAIKDRTGKMINGIFVKEEDL